MAQAEYPDGALPANQHDFDFKYLGLLTLEDPVRPEVPAAIQECQDAGIRVLMLTGDYPETARSIAEQLGIPGAVVSGPELSQTDDLMLQQVVRNTSVFARVTPEQKLRIVTALKLTGERVAMTGDGVNDAPSLKWADIGVAMGGRGTDVAREAASIVLLDDSFSSMVAAIRLGRRIYDNLQKAVFFILAIHIPIAGLAILPVVLKLPLLLLPAHILILVSRVRRGSLLGTIRKRNFAFLGVTAGALILLTLILSIASLRSLFGFALLHPEDLLLAVGTGLLSLGLINSVRHVRQVKSITGQLRMLLAVGSQLFGKHLFRDLPVLVLLARDHERR